jgi:predicted nucleic acid-binding protein
MAAFFKRYDDREPQLADASLVYLADHRETTTVFTLDQTDFSVYRTDSGKAFGLLPRPR